MCRGFDPLFSLWQDRARSFGGIFSHPPTPKRSFGVLKLPILTEFDLLGPKFHFSLDLFGSNFQRPAAHPIIFRTEYPPPGLYIFNGPPFFRLALVTVGLLGVFLARCGLVSVGVLDGWLQSWQRYNISWAVFSFASEYVSAWGPWDVFFLSCYQVIWLYWTAL